MESMFWGVMGASANGVNAGSLRVLVITQAKLDKTSMFCNCQIGVRVAWSLNQSLSLRTCDQGFSE